MPATEKTSLDLGTGVKNVIHISFAKIVFGGEKFREHTIMIMKRGSIVVL